jgi:hypothetical protein
MDSNARPGEMKIPSARLRKESAGCSSGKEGAIFVSLMIHS